MIVGATVAVRALRLVASGGTEFEVQQSAPESDTAKRLRLKALGCRFGYPGNTDVE